MIAALSPAEAAVERIGDAAAGPVRRLIADAAHPWQRVHGLWVLERLGALDAATINRFAE